MGQYYKIVNIDKKEWLDPFTFTEYEGCRKFMEFAPDSGSIMYALAILLNERYDVAGGDFPLESDLIGKWSRDRIAIVGDYGKNENNCTDNLYNISDDDTNWKDISKEVYDLMWSKYDNKYI